MSTIRAALLVFLFVSKQRCVNVKKGFCHARLTGSLSVKLTLTLPTYSAELFNPVLLSID